MLKESIKEEKDYREKRLSELGHYWTDPREKFNISKERNVHSLVRHLIGVFLAICIIIGVIVFAYCRSRELL